MKNNAKKILAVVLSLAMIATMLVLVVSAGDKSENVAANATVSVSYVDTANTATPSDANLGLINDGDYETNSNASAYWKVADGDVAVSLKFDKTYVIDTIFLATENWYIQGSNELKHTQKLHFEAKVNDAWVAITEVFDDVEAAGVENIDQQKNLVPVTIALNDYAITDEIRLVFDDCSRNYFNVKEIMVYGVEYDASNPPAVKPAATIGTTNYATLAEALTAAQAGDTVKLEKDLSLDATVVIDKAITLDGNGHTINVDAEIGVKLEADSANVAIKNVTINSTNMGMQLANCTSLEVKSTLTMTNTKINAANKKDGVEVLAFWAVNLDGVEINGGNAGFRCNAANGANVLDVKNSTIIGNGSYGFYMMQASTGTVTDSTIMTTAKGGSSAPNSAIQIKTSTADTTSVLTLNNVTASGAGYTVAVNPFNKIYINGGTYTMITGEGYVNADAVINVGNADAYCKITAGTFTSFKNCAVRVYTTSKAPTPNKGDTNPSVLDIEGGTFILNKASSTGSALRAGTGEGWGTANIKGGHFITNGTGAVVNTANAKGVINITGGIFENNGENTIKVVDNSGNAAVTAVDFPEGVKKVEFKNGAFVEWTEQQPENTTANGGETTTKPSDDVTTKPADDNTTEPSDVTTTKKPDDATTTEKPDDTKAPATTDAPKKEKSCGGFAVAAQIITVLGAAVTLVIVKKKH